MSYARTAPIIAPASGCAEHYHVAVTCPPSAGECRALLRASVGITSTALIPTRGLQHSLGLESSESLLVTRVMDPANHVLLSHSPRSVEHPSSVYAYSQCVYWSGVAIPRTTYSASTHPSNGATLMIPGSRDWPSGVMTHNHDLGITDAGHHAALVLSKDCVLYYTALHYSSSGSTMHAVCCTHSFSFFF